MAKSPDQFRIINTSDLSKEAQSKLEEFRVTSLRQCPDRTDGIIFEIKGKLRFICPHIFWSIDKTCLGSKGIINCQTSNISFAGMEIIKQLQKVVDEIKRKKYLD